MIRMQKIMKILRNVILQNWKQVLLSGASLVLLVTVWWLYSALLHGDWPFEGRERVDFAEYVPYPWVVVQVFIDSFQHQDASGLYMGEHVVASLKRISTGFVLALAVAVPAGLLMGRSKAAHAVGSPIVELLRPIPPLAWVPIFLVVFKFFWGPILIVFLGIVFPILLNVRLGARSVDPVLIDAARTLGARRSQIFLKVVFPYTIPYLMTGIKVGLGIGWMCIVAAEMLGAVGGGVGYYIFLTAGSSLYTKMYAGIVTIGLLSVLTTGVAGLFERWINKWMGTR